MNVLGTSSPLMTSFLPFPAQRTKGMKQLDRSGKTKYALFIGYHCTFEGVFLDAQETRTRSETTEHNLSVQ